MPRRPTSLRDPRVVLAVVVLFLVVAAVNIQTFLPLHRLGRNAAADGTATFSPPADAAEFKRIAAAHVMGVAVPELMPAVEPTGGEEPAASRPATTTLSQPAVEARHLPTADARTPLPSCTAILRTGAQPVALIDGVRRQVGDPVGGWVVTAISLDGATLQGLTGTVFLPVRSRDNASGKFSVVTDSDAALGAGNTALQPQAGSREP